MYISGSDVYGNYIEGYVDENNDYVYHYTDSDDNRYGDFKAAVSFKFDESYKHVMDVTKVLEFYPMNSMITDDVVANY